MSTQVLVVAEDIYIRRLLVAQLAEEGHVVIVAETMLDALAILQASPAPLVAFFDYRLPSIDSTLDLLPMLAVSGPEFQRHRYVLLSTTVPSRSMQELAARLSATVVVIPVEIGDLVWEITQKVRELDDLADAEAVPRLA